MRHTKRARWLMAGGAILVLVVLMLALATPALAGKTITEDNVVIGDESDDVYAFGQTVTVEGTVEGDVIAFAQTVTVNGTITGDLIAAGSGVIVNGEVQDDARLAGYAIELGSDATIGDDANLAGYSVYAESGSQIGGDAFFGAFQTLLDGDVAGDLIGGANSVQIGGQVGGDAKLSVGEPGEAPPFMGGWNVEGAPPIPSVPPGLTIKGGEIAGDLTYSSTVPSDVPANAVGGQLTFQLEEAEEAEEVAAPPSPAEAAMGMVLGFVRRFATLVVVGLLMMWLAPKALEGTAAIIRERWLPSLGWGFLGYAVTFGGLPLLFAVVIALAVLFGVVTLGGLSTAIVFTGIAGEFNLVLIFVLITSWVAKVVIGYLLGKLIFRPETDQFKDNWLPMVVGVLIVAALRSIPVIGGLVGLAAALFGLGALVLYLRGKWFPPKPAPAAEPAV
jgi:hypothetical protein